MWRICLVFLIVARGSLGILEEEENCVQIKMKEYGCHSPSDFIGETIYTSREARALVGRTEAASECISKVVRSCPAIPGLIKFGSEMMGFLHEVMALDKDLVNTLDEESCVYRKIKEYGCDDISFPSELPVIPEKIRALRSVHKKLVGCKLKVAESCPEVSSLIEPFKIMMNHVDDQIIKENARFEEIDRNIECFSNTLKKFGSTCDFGSLIEETGERIASFIKKMMADGQHFKEEDGPCLFRFMNLVCVSTLTDHFCGKDHGSYTFDLIRTSEMYKKDCESSKIDEMDSVYTFSKTLALQKLKEIKEKSKEQLKELKEEL